MSEDQNSVTPLLDTSSDIPVWMWAAIAGGAIAIAATGVAFWDLTTTRLRDIRAKRHALEIVKQQDLTPRPNVEVKEETLDPK